MANAPTSGLRRSKLLFVRFSDEEKEVVRTEAQTRGLSMDEYARCKILGIPFEHVSGRISQKSNSRKKQQKQHP